MEQQGMVSSSSATTRFNKTVLATYFFLTNLILLRLVLVIWTDESEDVRLRISTRFFFLCSMGVGWTTTRNREDVLASCSSSSSLSSTLSSALDPRSVLKNTTTTTAAAVVAAAATNTPTSIDGSNSTNRTNVYIRPNRIFGHLHMAKTGGTSVNGILANKYERVCGNKGYSYDAFQANEKALEKAGVTIHPQDNPRDQVRPAIMREIGYEDCDYVSRELHWTHWTNFSDFHGIPMELHVPCRDRVDHLMSNCNYRRKVLDCNADDSDLFRAVEECFLPAIEKRYSDELLHVENVHVKCYDFKKQFTVYMDYMAQYLQPRRLESKPYRKRETNRLRKKEEECIWSNPDVYSKVDEYLLHRYPYYSFCEKCLGSENDVTRE